jgi:hypothetical protein
MKTAGNHSTFTIPVLLVLVALAASLAFPPIQQIRDSLYWAKEVQQGTNLYALLNPHHLAYLPAVRALYVMLGKVCTSCTPVEAAQVLGLVSSAVAVVAVFFLAKRLAASAFIGAALALTLILSRTFWVFSMQVSPYVPMLAALALFALTIVTRGERLQEDNGPMLAVSCAFAAAVLLHQAAILIGFSLLAYLFASRPPRDASRALLKIAICSGGIVLVAYVAAYALISGADAMSFAGFATYLTRYGSTSNPCCATFANFSVEGISTLLEGHFETFMSPPWSLRQPAVYALGAGILLLAGWNIVRLVSGDRSAIRLFFVSWLAIMLAFLLWAYPESGVPPMLNVVPIIALISLAVGDFLQFARTQRHPAAMQLATVAPLLAVVLLFGVRNFADAVGPLHSTLGSKYEKARLLAAAAPERCTIVEGDQEVLMNLYYYFNRAGLDAWDLFTWFYFGKEDKPPWTWAKFRFSDHDCIVIEAKYLSPTMPVQQHLVDNSAADRWYAYIEWLLGFDYESGRVSSTRCLNDVADSRGSRYLVVNLRERCDTADLEAVMQQLDAHLGAIDRQHSVAVFSDWFAQHRLAVPALRQRRFRDVLGNLDYTSTRSLAGGATGGYHLASSDRIPGHQ